MPYGQSMNSFALLHHWRFDEKKRDRLTEKVCFHKLTFRVNDTKTDKDNYYNKILELYNK